MAGHHAAGSPPGPSHDHATSDGQALAVLEEAEDESALGGTTLGVYETEFAPGICRGSGWRALGAPKRVGAVPAAGGGFAAYGGIDEQSSMLVFPSMNLNLVQSQLSPELVAAWEDFWENLFE